MPDEQRLVANKFLIDAKSTILDEADKNRLTVYYDTSGIQYSGSAGGSDLPSGVYSLPVRVSVEGSAYVQIAKEQVLVAFEVEQELMIKGRLNNDGDLDVSDHFVRNPDAGSILQFEALKSDSQAVLLTKDDAGAKATEMVGQDALEGLRDFLNSYAQVIGGITPTNNNNGKSLGSDHIARFDSFIRGATKSVKAYREESMGSEKSTARKM